MPRGTESCPMRTAPAGRGSGVTPRRVPTHQSAEIHSAVADAVAVASTRLPEVAPDSGAGDRPQDAAELAVLKVRALGSMHQCASFRLSRAPQEDTLLGLDPARIPEAGTLGPCAWRAPLLSYPLPVLGVSGEAARLQSLQVRPLPPAAGRRPSVRTASRLWGAGARHPPRGAIYARAHYRA